MTTTGPVNTARSASTVSSRSNKRAVDGSLPRVTVRLGQVARWVVEEYPVDSVTELDDGRLEARFAVVSERWLERLLLRAGAAAEVVEPATWRDLGARAAERLLQRYR